ncbi:hypothetical protein P7K49_020483 [Saguinus oedipus]|uniref:Uncharacterized protein n=1 Tax=Saguinus oedipus TaxID=9490 RepID=A0ABQ9V119_SAGOE|nr:hypothetical protein P7K49_020483 [Saguinus oedipus]
MGEREAMAGQGSSGGAPCKLPTVPGLPRSAMPASSTVHVLQLLRELLAFVLLSYTVLIGALLLRHRRARPPPPASRLPPNPTHRGTPLKSRPEPRLRPPPQRRGAGLSSAPSGPLRQLVAWRGRYDRCPKPRPLPPHQPYPDYFLGWGRGGRAPPRAHEATSLPACASGVPPPRDGGSEELAIAPRNLTVQVLLQPRTLRPAHGARFAYMLVPRRPSRAAASLPARDD